MLDQATRLRELSGQRPRYTLEGITTQPYIITVTSGKGGVGKSTVALNLALRISEFGRRVLLVDGGSNLANLHIMMGIDPKYTLADVLDGKKDLREVLVCPYPGLRFLPGISGRAHYPLLGNEEVKGFLEDVISEGDFFDFLVIDTAAGLTSDVVALTACADKAIVITTPEPTAVVDAYAMIKTLSITRSKLAISILVNNAQFPAEAEETARKLQMAVQHFLRIPVSSLGFIPFDASVGKAVVSQQPVIRGFPNCGASLSFKLLAQCILEEFDQSRGRRIVAR